MRIFHHLIISILLTKFIISSTLFTDNWNTIKSHQIMHFFFSKKVWNINRLIIIQKTLLYWTFIWIKFFLHFKHANKPELTCATNVPIQIPKNTGFLLNPSNMFRCPWIFRALTSLNKVIITKELNMMVKCCVGGAWIFWYFPSSISNKLFPERENQNYYIFFWNYNLKLKIQTKIHFPKICILLQIHHEHVQ